jgi:hypothetical protein
VGAKVDPATGEWVWTFHVPIEEQLAYYASHPPRCVRELVCTPTELPDCPFDGHGEPVNAVFAVTCPCGGDTFIPYGSAGPDHTDLRAPYYLECDQCDESWMVFDPYTHGFDPEIEPGRTTPRTDLIEYEIGDTEVHAFVRFEMPSDHLGDPEERPYRGREEDFFSWFTLVGKDPESGRVAVLGDWECA